MEHIDLDKRATQTSFSHRFVENKVKIEKKKKNISNISGAISVSILKPTNLGRPVK
jgi:hypothetical protein